MSNNFLFTCLAFLLSLSYASTQNLRGIHLTATQVSDFNVWKECDQQAYEQANIFYTTGLGLKIVDSTVGSVTLGIKIVSKEAADALDQANALLNKAVSAIKSTNLTSSSNTTFTTSQLTILPYTLDQFNNTTNTSQAVQVGFTVTNLLTVRTKRLKFVAKIIDLAVKNGVNDVQSVSFDIEDQEKQDLQESLINDAVLDAQVKAKLALSEIGYRIIGIKSVNIIDTPVNQYSFANQNQNNNNNNNNNLQSQSQVFAGNQQVQTQVTVGFVIQKINSTITLSTNTLSTNTSSTNTSSINTSTTNTSQ